MIMSKFYMPIFFDPGCVHDMRARLPRLPVPHPRTAARARTRRTWSKVPQRQLLKVYRNVTYGLTIRNCARTAHAHGSTSLILL
jgi:hypothetical protein